MRIYWLMRTPSGVGSSLMMYRVTSLYCVVLTKCARNALGFHAAQTACAASSVVTLPATFHAVPSRSAHRRSTYRAAPPPCSSRCRSAGPAWTSTRVSYRRRPPADSSPLGSSDSTLQHHANSITARALSVEDIAPARHSGSARQSAISERQAMMPLL